MSGLVEATLGGSLTLSMRTALERILVGYYLFTAAIVGWVAGMAVAYLLT